MVTLVDYGLGNIRAFQNAYLRMNIPVAIATTPAALLRARRIILPGVGAFDWAIDRLNSSGMRDALDELVLGRRTPVLGICVGMQIMARRSEEGHRPGLGWIDAEVRKLEPADRSNARSRALALPHMGWNEVIPVADHPLFAGLVSPRFYFLHSYFWVPSNDTQTIATSNYAGTFSAAVARDYIAGVQFHPEKSHGWGTALLRNFAA